MASIGHIQGKILLQLSGGEPIEVGTLRIPLEAATVKNDAGTHNIAVKADLENSGAEIIGKLAERYLVR